MNTGAVRALAAAAAAGLLGIWAVAARADQVVLTPVDAQAETQDGVVWVVTPNSSSLNCSRFSGIPLRRRGLLEFPLGAIPVGSTIQSAVLSYAVNSFTGGGTGDPSRMELHGYAGDGALTPADATVPANLVGLSGPITALGDGSTPVDPSYLGSLLGVASHLGIATEQATVGRQASIWSTESGATGPRLTVTFTPPNARRAVITPLDGWARTENGTAWVLDTTGQSIEVYLAFSGPLEDRGILEFPLAVLPRRARVLSARLEFTANTRNFPPNPVIQFHAYPGDGVVSVADATRPFNPAGSVEITALERHSAAIDRLQVEANLDAGAHLGLLCVQPNRNSQTGFWSSEFFDPAARPRLVVLYFCAADTDGNGAVGLQDLFDFLGLYFAGHPRADVDRSGSVSVQDVFEFLVAYFAGCP